MAGRVGRERDDAQRCVVVRGDEQVVVTAREAGSIDRGRPRRREQRGVRCHRDDTEPVRTEGLRSLRRRHRRDLPVGKAAADAVGIVLVARRRRELIARRQKAAERVVAGGSRRDQVRRGARLKRARCGGVHVHLVGALNPADGIVDRRRHTGSEKHVVDAVLRERQLASGGRRRRTRESGQRVCICWI